MLFEGVVYNIIAGKYDVAANEFHTIGSDVLYDL